MEPTTTGEDFLCVLNAEERHAHVQVTIFYTNRDPVGPYGLTVAARRVRQVRFNDLVGRQAVVLDAPYQSRGASPGCPHRAVAASVGRE
jgi:hypothetical protein